MSVRIDFEGVESAARVIENAVERLQIQTAKLKTDYEEFAALSSPPVPFAKSLLRYTENLNSAFTSLQQANEDFNLEIKKYEREAEEISAKCSV